MPLLANVHVLKQRMGGCAGGIGDNGGGNGGGGLGGGCIGGGATGGERKRAPQSAQSVPYKHESPTEPGPPSWQYALPAKVRSVLCIKPASEEVTCIEQALDAHRSMVVGCVRTASGVVWGILGSYLNA